MRAPTRLVTDDHGAQGNDKARCVACDRPVPAGTKGPGRTCGDPECRKAFAQWVTSQRRNVRRARLERLIGQRTCDGCGRTFPLDAEHFQSAGRGYYRRRCIECQRAVERAHSLAAYRRRRADPERWAAYLAACRIEHRLRREQETGQVPPRKFRTATDAYRSLSGSRADLGLEPLRAWLEAVVEREAPEARRGGNDPAARDGQSLRDLAYTLGVDTRALWRIQHAEHNTVSLGTADRLLTNYGRPVVIRSRDLERRLVDWAQSLPGNGERILRYMDRAEAVGHLADVAVSRLEDLWPELED